MNKSELVEAIASGSGVTKAAAGRALDVFMMTVTQALVLGGGLTPRGTLKGITIKRQAADGSVVEKKVGLDDFVQANDVLLLKESWF